MDNNIKLDLPTYGFDIVKSINQYFGVNAELYKKNYNLPAHNGLDVRVNYGDPVLAMHDGTVEKITYDVPHKTKGNGVYIMSEGGSYSTNYWHLSGFQCSIGDKVHSGQIIGLAGNSGTVFPKPSTVNPKAGTHLHIGLRLNGHRNDYKGFVDPTPHLYRKGNKLKMSFNRNLWWGYEGDSVSHLQTILKIEGFAKDYEPIAYAGRKTIRDVKLFQLKHRITPAYGYVGPKTRQLLNNLYSYE